MQYEHDFEMDYVQHVTKWTFEVFPQDIMGILSNKNLNDWRKKYEVYRCCLYVAKEIWKAYRNRPRTN